MVKEALWFWRFYVQSDSRLLTTCSLKVLSSKMSHLTSLVSHDAVFHYFSSYFCLAWLHIVTVAPQTLVKLIQQKHNHLFVSHRGCSKWGKDIRFTNLRWWLFLRKKRNPKKQKRKAKKKVKGDFDAKQPLAPHFRGWIASDSFIAFLQRLSS